MKHTETDKETNMFKKIFSLFALGIIVIYLGFLTLGCATTGGGEYYRSDRLEIPDHGIPSDLP